MQLAVGSQQSNPQCGTNEPLLERTGISCTGLYEILHGVFPCDTWLILTPLLSQVATVYRCPCSCSSNSSCRFDSASASYRCCTVCRQHFTTNTLLREDQGQQIWLFHVYVYVYKGGSQCNEDTHKINMAPIEAVPTSRLRTRQTRFEALPRCRKKLTYTRYWSTASHLTILLYHIAQNG